MGAMVVGCSGDDPSDVSAQTADGLETTEEGAMAGAGSERFLRPDEWPAAMVACMREEGFAAEVIPPDGVDYAGNPDEVNEELQVANERCGQENQIDPRYFEPLDESAAAFLYDYFTTALVPCLEGEGFEGFDPPAEGVFIEDVLAERAYWIPYQHVPGSAHTPELEARCPQSPDPDELMNARQS